MSGGTGVPAEAGAGATDDGEQSSGSSGEQPTRRIAATGDAAWGAAG
ncbi:hypothetical protein [Micromonospora sp. NPDC003241]